MRVVAIALDLSRSANVLPVTFGNAVGVTVGNSALLQVRNKLFVFLGHWLRSVELFTQVVVRGYFLNTLTRLHRILQAANA